MSFSVYSDIILSQNILKCSSFIWNNIVLYLHACYRVGGMLPGEHYEILLLFVVYFVLKISKILISI